MSIGMSGDPLFEAMRLALSVDDVKKKPLVRLLEHMVWADSLVAESLAAATPAHGASSAEVAEAWGLYAHVLGAEQIWLARILGQPDGPVWPTPDPAALDALRDEVLEGYGTLLTELTDEELGLVIPYANSAGDRFHTSVEDILHHVFLHGAYHRGQVALLLRTCGADPAPSDFIAFARGAPAATRDDSD
ncbi:MAG: DinB family protein [Gemmatimonadetes bacterium]|nr:DinB family protein [Gemmatimonadota bacterium]